jgi:hypothetical protein
MAPVKKAAKKATKPTKKAAKKAPANKPDTSEARAEREARDAELTAQIVELKEAGEKWSAITEAVGISPGKAMFLYEVSQVAPKDRIKYNDDDDLAKKIVAARKDGLSWGTIMARANISEGKARGLWEAATGKSTKGERIGKGGRFPAGTAPAKKAAAPAKKAAKKAAGAVKKGGAPTKPGEIKNVNDMNLREITDRLTGRKIKVGVGGKQVTIGVKEVLGLEGGELSFTDLKGADRTIKVSNITNVSK